MPVHNNYPIAQNRLMLMHQTKPKPLVKFKKAYTPDSSTMSKFLSSKLQLEKEMNCIRNNAFSISNRKRPAKQIYNPGIEYLDYLI